MHLSLPNTSLSLSLLLVFCALTFFISLIPVHRAKTSTILEWTEYFNLISIVKLEVLRTECEVIGSPKAYELSKCGEPYSASVADYAQPNNVSYTSCQDLKWYLTHGAVSAIMKGEMAVEQRPVMQVVDFSLMSQNGFSFYRILLSDGVHQVHVNLFPHLSHMVVDNYLQKGTRVRLLKFIRDTFNQDKNYRYGSHYLSSVKYLLNINPPCKFFFSL
jgi:hypothetical protein